MKKVMDFVFIMAFLLCIVLPGFNMEFGKNVKSEIDNAYLPEIEFTGFEEFETSMTDYVDKRIGFRQESLWLYQKLNDSLFSIMEHPLYMLGENGFIYFKYEESVKSYQHLNLDEEYAQKFGEALLNFQNYAQDKGMEFMYFLIPDKETVYPEFYPKNVNVCGSVSLADQIIKSLEERGVNYYFAKDTMIEAKDEFLVNNVKYDAGHWNDNGAFVSIQHLYELLQEKYPQLQVIQKDEFNIENVLMENLDVSNFEIREEAFEYYLEQLKPDIVIYENPERSHKLIYIRNII